MKSLLGLFSLLLITGNTTWAQQEYHLSNSITNPFLLNPAAGGMTDVIHFELSSRIQWLGYDGAPHTFMVAGNSQFSLRKKNVNILGEFNQLGEKLFKGPKTTVAKKKHIIGGKAWNDAVGPFSKTSFQMSYAYHLPLTQKLNFGLGMGIGMSNFRINQEKVKLYQQDDNTITQYLGNSAQQNMVDAQVGFVIYGERLYFGLSSSQLFNNVVVLGNTQTQNRFNRHLFGMLKYKIGLSETMALEPSVLVKSVGGAPLSYDIGARLISKERSWLTFQYRRGGSLIFQAGSNLINNIYLAYSYEHSSGKLRLANNGTHELQIGWYIGKNRNLEEELRENRNSK